MDGTKLVLFKNALKDALETAHTAGTGMDRGLRVDLIILGQALVGNTTALERLSIGSDGGRSGGFGLGEGGEGVTAQNTDEGTEGGGRGGEDGKTEFDIGPQQHLVVKPIHTDAGGSL